MKNIIIFGTGEFGKDAYRYYREKEDVHIMFFCDNSIEKQNTELFGKKILSPNILLKDKYDEIVVASSFDNEIVQQLKSFSIEDKYIKVLNPNEIKIQLGNGKKFLLATQLTKDIASFFNKHQIPYHIDHGTLLGIMRDNHLIEWDTDIDFAALDTNIAEVFKLLQDYLVNYSAKYCQNNRWKCTLYNCDMNFNNSVQLLPMVIKIFNDCDDEISNSLFVDIEFKYKEGENLYWMIGSRKLSAPYRMCFPTKSILFQNQEIQVPGKSSEYLSLLYGNWKQELKDWSYNHFDNITLQ